MPLVAPRNRDFSRMFSYFVGARPQFPIVGLPFYSETRLSRRSYESDRIGDANLLGKAEASYRKDLRNKDLGQKSPGVL